MGRKFAIFRTAKVKDWNVFNRLVRHSERSGDTPPTNVDKERTKLNRRLFSKPSGEKAAKTRWKKRVGKQKVRTNAVLASELFLGMIDGVVMAPEKLRNWQAANLRWVRKIFGPRNLIAGASNLYEKTPHGIVVFRKRLNDRLRYQYFRSKWTSIPLERSNRALAQTGASVLNTI